MAKTIGKKIRGLAPRAALGGFTAIEIAMVATVIAIFALLVLPIFRNRVEQARIAAAKADLVSFMKAETLAQADTAFYFRLEDLDNVEMTDQTGGPNGGITIQTPPFAYYADTAENQRRALFLTEWQGLGGTAKNPKFRGPYITNQHYALYRDFLPGGTNATIGSYLFHSQNSLAYTAYYDYPAILPSNIYDSQDNHIPIDPWGNPYLFFPRTNFSAPSVVETNYQNSAIYSLGPDFKPGTLTGTVPGDYLKTTPGGLGTEGTDDLSVQF